MATVKTDEVKHGAGRAELGLNVRFATHTLSGSESADDVVEMINVADGETVVMVQLISADADTNGSPTITYDVGDGDDPDYFLDGSTIGQAGGNEFSGVAPRSYSATDTIDVTIKTAAATGAAVDITLIAFVDK